MTVAKAPVAPEPTPGRPRVGRRTDSQTTLKFLEAYALLGLLIVVGVFFSVYSETSDTFLTSANLQILISNQVVPAIVALAALIPLVCNEFDLSVGAITGLVAIFVASMLSSGIAVPLVILIGLAMAALVGIANALLVTRAAVNGVITTLGTSIIIAGIVNQKTSGAAQVSDIPDTFVKFGSSNTLGLPTIAWALLAITLIVYFVLEHTTYGREIYALGSNATAAKLVGLRTRLLVGSTFVLAGTLAGLAGVIAVARSGGADPATGPNYTLTGLAAAFLSAAAIKPGRFNVAGTIVAVFFLAVLNNGLNLAGSAPYVTSYVNGAALIIGVSLATSLSRRRLRGAG